MKMFRSKKGKEYALAISAVVGIVAIVGLLLLFTGGSSSTQTDTGTLVTGAASAEPKGTCKIGPNQQSAVISLGTGVFDNAKSVCDASGDNCGKCIELCREFPKINDKFGCSLDGDDGFCNPDFPSDPDCCSSRTTVTFNTDVSKRSSSPKTSGNIVVWTDNRDSNLDIYMFDRSSSVETQVTTDLSNQENPEIDGNTIVWQDNRNGNLDIYMYDILSGVETQITSDSGDQTKPQVSGNLIVWSSSTLGSEGIYVYERNTTSTTRVSNQPGFFAVNDQTIVYSATSTASVRPILVYDVSSGTSTTIFSQSFAFPYRLEINDNVVFFTTSNIKRNGLYNIATGSTLLDAVSIFGQFPQLTDSDIIDLRFSTFTKTWSIFSTDLNTLVRTTLDTMNLLPSSIDQNQIDAEGQTIVWARVDPSSGGGVQNIEIYDRTIVCP